MKKLDFKAIPGVDTLLNESSLSKLATAYGHELVTVSIRHVIAMARSDIKSGKPAPALQDIIAAVQARVKARSEPSLKPVVNATGIVLHTNLGRAPLGEYILQEIIPVVKGYSNLEFDLQKGKRGERNSHIDSLLAYITGAPAALVVNNNAAAVMLILKTFAYRREVIISRGELIEIGGSFRIPEIMQASGARMVEVGTTNRTHLEDYEKAITDRTAIIMKAHKSNYFISGFTAEVHTQALIALAHRRNLLFMYDMGSGLLRRPRNLPLEEEPDVRTALSAGCDLVSFSGDKLLGGPQAGIIAGKEQYVKKLAKAPMIRALRVDKLTIAALSAAVRSYLRDEDLVTNLPIFSMLNRDQITLAEMADELSRQLTAAGIRNRVVNSPAQVGGGSLPHLVLKSRGVLLLLPETRKNLPRKIYQHLLQLPLPILAVLREGKVIFDVLTLNKTDFPYITTSLRQLLEKET